MGPIQEIKTECSTRRRAFPVQLHVTTNPEAKKDTERKPGHSASAAHEQAAGALDYQLNPQSTRVRVGRPDQRNQDAALANFERVLSTLIVNAGEKPAIYYLQEKAASILAGSLDSSF